MRKLLMKMEMLILRNLIYNESYLRKVLPFIQSDYFNDRCEKTLFEEIELFVVAYNTPPSIEALIISIKEKNTLTDVEVNKCETYIKEIESSSETTTELQWLVDKTEKFCQEKAIYNAVLESISILDGKDKKNEKGAIPNILSDALSVSFDTKVGHDYIDSSDERFEFYHKVENRIPFHIDVLNRITRGGVPKKTLNGFLAGPHVGKSLGLCDLSCHYLSIGKNVLYITMEMSEESTAERHDANLMNISMDEMPNLSKQAFDRKIESIKSKTVGKLIIKEYPTSGASTTHFRTLLNELKLKKGFIPDVIMVDYLSICASSKMKMGGSINSFMYVKSIGEELRALAIEYDVALWTGIQLNRTGADSSDPDMTDVAESFGLAAIFDFMLGMIRSEELDELNQLMFKQLKNRYKDMSFCKRFVVGVDRSKMKMYDSEDSAQNNLAGTNQITKSPANKFEGFKI